MKIVLISGRQGSGKTTLQEALIASYTRRNMIARSLNFASVLYEMHDAVREIGDRYKIPRTEPKDGPLLQLLGTEWGRNTKGANVWVDVMQTSLRQYLGQMDLQVIGDCRFENEFDAFPQALRVRLNCDEAVRKARCSQWRPNANHPSETGLDSYSMQRKFDVTINTADFPISQVVDIVDYHLQKNEWRTARL